MYKFNKVAGLILDRQDDPGAGWDLISAFWPSHMDTPDVGLDVEKTACIINLTDGIDKIARYPVDTPENTLASSMYFLAFGQDAIDDVEDIVKIATTLQEYRIAHNVSLPQDFKDFIKNANVQDDYVEEVYADADDNLPVTTPEQTLASIQLFSKNAQMWPASERMLCSAKLEKAAEYHNIESNMEFGSTDMSKHASGAIDLRLALIKQLGMSLDNDELNGYVDGMEGIKVAMLNQESYSDMLKIAEAIENLDREFGLDDAWGNELPDPVESVLNGFNTNPFDVEKQAGTDWDSVNWNELPFEEDVINSIKEDPEVVIPTLPTAQRNIVEDHVHGK